LAVHPAQIASRVDVSAAGVGQGQRPVRRLAPGLHVEGDHVVVHGHLRADGDPAHRVDDVAEPGEPGLDVAVDLDPDRLLDGLDQEFRAAQGERGIDLVLAVTGDLDMPARLSEPTMR
jgi:hypothetical protein